MNSAKKRRVGEGGGGAEQSNSCGLVHEELKALSSYMTKMMEHNRDMMDMMKSMQGEIARLTNESNKMKQTMDTMHRTQNANYNTTNQMKQTINAMQTAQTTNSRNTNSRFDDVDNKLNYHEVLLKNQQWKYSAPRPSEEYWNNTVGEDEVAAAESFLTQIKQHTEEMRYGTSNRKVVIDPELIDDELPYNEAFLPHWEEFATALEQHQYCLKSLPRDSDTELKLFDMELPDTVLSLLSKGLESTNFTRFVLRDNNFGQAGIEFALKYLKNNRILKKFNLYNNPFDNISDIKQLCQVVKNHPSVEEIDLVGCRGEEVDGYEMLQMIMNAGKSNLTSIVLSYNEISTGGDTFISDFLADNPILETLFLDGNQLDDNDAIAIASALKQNTILRTIGLRDNNISKSGWEALRKAEFDDTSLNSASDSNHSCTIKYPSGDDEIQGLDTSEMNGNSDYHFDSLYVRRKKVYSVLSTRNRLRSNVGHFDDVPVEVLPDMLSTIQQYSKYHSENSEMSQDTNYVNPLSIVYEVCRYWDESLAVYELLSS